MKKVFIFLMAFILCITLAGCNKDHNEDEQFINDYDLTEFVLKSEKEGLEDAGLSMSLDFMYNLSYQNFKLYTCELDNKDNMMYVAGYIDNETIKYLNSFDEIEYSSIFAWPLGEYYHVYGINDYLYKYQRLYDHQMLDTNDYPIYFKIYNQNEISCNLNDKELILVVRIQKCNLTEIKSGNTEIMNLCVNARVEFNQSKSHIIILGDYNNCIDVLYDKYLFTAKVLEKYYLFDMIPYFLVPIQKYNKKDVIYESCNVILGSSDYNNYYEKIKTCIISPNKELEEYSYFMYDFEKIKKIFMR